MAPKKGTSEKPAGKKPTKKASRHKSETYKRCTSTRHEVTLPRISALKCLIGLHVCGLQVLKQVHPELGFSSNAMGILNAFIIDNFDRIAHEAGRISRFSNKRTLTAREVQTAIKMVMPGELAKHAVSEGAKAVTSYNNSS